MKKLPIRLLLMMFGIALLLGATHRQLLDYFLGGEGSTFQPEGQPDIVIPEGGIRSDAFSLRLLNEALEATPGSTCVCPAAMVELLRRLHDIGGDATRKLIGEQVPGIAEAPAPSAATLQSYTQLFADNGLDFAPGASVDDALRVPLHSDFTRALPLINAVAEQGTEGFASHMLDGQPISSETRLLALSAARFARPWRSNFHLLGLRNDRDFYHADGSIRPMRMMASRDTHTVAKAADGSWEAAAIFFRSEGRGGAPACFVAIMPAKGADARAFARGLTAEKLSAIRRELALAPPRELTLVLPQLQLRAATADLHPLLLRMGLGSLFSRKADFSRLCRDAQPLDLALGKYAFALDAGSGGDTGSSSETLRFDRPFIWFIGDLTTPNPPCFMGLME